MNSQAKIDHGRPTADLDSLDRAMDRSELAEALLEVVGETLVVDLALVVLNHPEHGRPTVFGGRFDDRRQIGRTLRLRAGDADKGVAAVGSWLGPTVRVVRIGDTADLHGMIIVGSAQRGLRGDEIEFVRELAEKADENLQRLASSATKAEAGGVS